MTAHDAAELVKAILRHSDPRWCTPNGAFLDLLCRFAAEGRIETIATACHLYFRATPTARAFVASSLPAIIVNFYKPIFDGVSFQKFITWTARHPRWSAEIREQATSQGLVRVVDRMVDSLQRA